jgi:hypothetical protein
VTSVAVAKFVIVVISRSLPLELRSSSGTAKPRCPGSSRAGGTYPVSSWCRTASGSPAAACLRAEFSQANYGLPVEQLETIQMLAAGPPSYVAERLGAYVAAGARHIAIRIAAGTMAAQREQLEELIKLKPLLTAG